MFRLNDPVYLATLPMVPASGFQYCIKLGRDDPDSAVRNSNSIALFALGKSNLNFATHQQSLRKGKKLCSFAPILGLFLDRNNWAAPYLVGYAAPLPALLPTLLPAPLPAPLPTQIPQIPP